MDFDTLLKNIDKFNNLPNTLDTNSAVIHTNSAEINNPLKNTQRVEAILKNSIPIFSKKNYRGNQYELDQFNWEIQKAEYYSKIRREKLGIKKRDTTEVETFDKLQQILTTDEYSKKWNKLDLFCKKQKFKQYITQLKINGVIEEEEEKIYLNYLFKMLTKKILTKSTEVKYDIEKQIITNIPILDNKIKALTA